PLVQGRRLNPVAAFGGIEQLDQVVRTGQAARMGGEDRVSTALHVGAAIVDCLPRSPLDSRLVLAVEPARAGDADSVVQGDRGAHGAARLEMRRLMLEFAQGGFPAGGRW